MQLLVQTTNRADYKYIKETNVNRRDSIIKNSYKLKNEILVWGWSYWGAKSVIALGGICIFSLPTLAANNEAKNRSSCQLIF